MNELDILEKEMQRTPEKQAELNAIIQQQAKAEAEYLDMVEWYRTKEQQKDTIGIIILTAAITFIITIIITKWFNWKTSDKHTPQKNQASTNTTKETHQQQQVN